MKITLTNDFHNTAINLIPKNNKLSVAQIKRARRALCVNGCTCSSDFGTRGRQDGFELEVIYNNRTGQISGAHVYTV